MFSRILKNNISSQQGLEQTSPLKDCRSVPENMPLLPILYPPGHIEDDFTIRRDMMS